MTTEEKAQAYDEALERAKEINDERRVQPFDVMARVFPELNDSEDERIRKEIQSVIKQLNKDTTICGKKYNYSQWIAWLEKQNEQLKIKQDMLITFRNSVPEEWDFSKDKDLKEEVDRCFHNGMFPKYITQYTTITVSDLMRCASHFYKFGKEHKSADKVEPNFREGDWIINNDKRIAVPTQILKIEKYGYVTSSGYTSFDKVKTDYHLWTIQDAKDGDVLSFDNESSNYHSIGIFKRIASKYELNGNTYRCYVRYGGFEEKLEIPINGDELHHCGTSAHPAVKEQCDLLFQKMKEAGCKWDAEKKELIMIENVSAWSEEDENALDIAIRIIQNGGDDCAGILDSDKALKWLKSLKDRVLSTAKAMQTKTAF